MDAPFDLLPNFFIIGAPKAGTTALYSYLRQHPGIYLPETKEPHFFNEDHNYGRGIEFYADAYFRQAGGFPLRGEATPMYMREHAAVIPRLKGLYAARPLKFIVCLRNPIDRAFSHYHNAVATGREHESFERGLELEDERRGQNAKAWVQYAHEGFYDEQLAQWFAAYPREWFHFVITERLDEQRAEEIRKVLGFLGADPGFDIDSSKRENVIRKPRFAALTGLYNPAHPLRPAARLVPKSLKRYLRGYMRDSNLVTADARPEIRPDTREALRRRFEPHNRRLAAMLDLDLSGWR